MPTAVAEQPPADLEQMRAAFRLGWAVAELRGRYRPDLFLHPEPDAPKAFKRNAQERPLPLAGERKSREIRIEIYEAAVGLSGALDLNLQTRRAGGSVSTLELVKDATLHIENAKNAAERRSVWPSVAQRFYDWDAQLQDTLVVDATRAAAYQLGRALGETHWALEPARGEREMGSWVFLFGAEREAVVKRLLERLSPYLGPLVVAGVKHSHKAWCKLALAPQRRNADGVRLRLYEQGVLWRDLIRGERQPLELPRPVVTDPWREVAGYRKAVKALKGPLIVGGFFAALLIVGGALLASGAKDPWLTTAVSILGGLGVTSAGLYARAKAQLTSLLSTLRLELDKQKVREAADLCPKQSEAHMSRFGALWDSLRRPHL
ncbi:MAG TPA: hypothetical protein VK272_03450 [Solirubrobacteraceae bacterium]|nr:hypothetical protein [Solirubrobacteraceae bacterium]